LASAGWCNRPSRAKSPAAADGQHRPLALDCCRIARSSFSIPEVPCLTFLRRANARPALPHCPRAPRPRKDQLVSPGTAHFPLSGVSDRGCPSHTPGRLCADGARCLVGLHHVVRDDLAWRRPRSVRGSVRRGRRVGIAPRSCMFKIRIRLSALFDCGRVWFSERRSGTRPAQRSVLMLFLGRLRAIGHEPSFANVRFQAAR
jgi:hypothetical protein